MLILQGKHVWVPDPDEVVLAGKAKDSFHPGEPTQVEVGYSIQILDEKRTAEVYEMNQQVLDPKINDLMALEELSEHALFYKLRLRFEQNEIYTALAAILIAINPFQALPLYTPEIQKQYIACTLDTIDQQDPHVFKTVQKALLTMMKGEEGGEGFEDGVAHSIILYG